MGKIAIFRGGGGRSGRGTRGWRLPFFFFFLCDGFQLKGLALQELWVGCGEVKGGETIDSGQMIFLPSLLHVSYGWVEDDVPPGEGDLKVRDGFEKVPVSGEVFPYNHLHCGSGGEMLHREEAGDSGGEDIVTSEGIDGLTALKVLDPCQHEGGEFCHIEVVLSRRVKLEEVPVPCSREQVTGRLGYLYPPYVKKVGSDRGSLCKHT